MNEFAIKLELYENKTRNYQKDLSEEEVKYNALMACMARVKDKQKGEK